MEQGSPSQALLDIADRLRPRVAELSPRRTNEIRGAFLDVFPELRARIQALRARSDCGRRAFFQPPSSASYLIGGAAAGMALRDFLLGNQFLPQNIRAPGERFLSLSSDCPQADANEVRAILDDLVLATQGAISHTLINSALSVVHQPDLIIDPDDLETAPDPLFSSLFPAVTPRDLALALLTQSLIQDPDAGRCSTSELRLGADNWRRILAQPGELLSPPPRRSCP